MHAACRGGSREGAFACMQLAGGLTQPGGSGGALGQAARLGSLLGRLLGARNGAGGPRAKALGTCT